jgi:hypothetical protein
MADAVPLNDLPSNLVPASDLPDHLAPPQSAQYPRKKEYTIANPDPSYVYPNNPLLPLRGKPNAEGPPTPELAWPGIVRGILSVGEKVRGVNTPPPLTGGLTPNESAAVSLGAFGEIPAVASGIESAGNAAARLSSRMSDVQSRGLSKAPAGAPTLSEAKAINKQIGVEVKAPEVIARRVNQDIKAGYTTAQGVIDQMIKDRALGKPVTLSDADLPNVRGLTGNVARKPGTAQAIVKGSAEERDSGAQTRLRADVARDLSGGDSAYRTSQALVESRQAEAQPLYDKAFEGGSVAPLERQFEDAFNQASKDERQASAELASAQARLTAASARQSQAGMDVYATSGANTDARAAEAAIAQAQKSQTQAAATKQKILDKLRQAQTDKAMDTPGSVWNPRIQQFLDDPIMKRGMASGVEIQRLEALAAGKPFDPTELAITPEGEVTKVPNMRTLDAGKKGLDAIIESEGRDKFGRMNQMGRAVNQVRVSYLKELDNINPDYSVARSAWSGHSSSLDAVKFGKNFTNMSQDEIAEEFSNMNPNDQEFARLGVADNLLERLGKTGMSGDEAKALVKNEWTKGQLRPFFRSEADFSRFIDSVAAERRMFEADRRILSGSQTAEREEESSGDRMNAAIHASHSLGSLLFGHPIRAVISGARAVRDLGLKTDPQLNEAIARILRDPSFLPGIENGKITIPTQTIPPRAP